MNSKKVFNVALLQIDADKSLDSNFKKARKWLVKAKDLGADIALFPELWTIGYEMCPEVVEDFNIWKKKSTWSGESEFERYRKLAKEIGIAIVITYLESNKSRTKFYNTADLIDSKGIVLHSYRKTHLVDKAWERMFTAGDKFPVSQLKFSNGKIKIGIMICYDREFPEVARILMLNGAEIVLVPNACSLENNRIAQFQSRGFENMIGVAMTNYPRFEGKSVAFDGMREKGKDYDPLLVLGDQSEKIFLAKFNLNKFRTYRQREIWGDAYRRPKLYKLLLEDDPQPPFKRNNARRSRAK